MIFSHFSDKTEISNYITFKLRKMTNFIATDFNESTIELFKCIISLYGLSGSIRIKGFNQCLHKFKSVRIVKFIYTTSNSNIL